MDSTPDWLYQQSAVIPYRRAGGHVEVLLITSRKGNWIIPKGIVEQELSPAESAAQEALEEAGVAGEVSKKPVGEFQYDKWGGTCHVDVFLMEVARVHPQWLEEDFRRREWLTIPQAVKRVHRQELKDLLLRLELFIGI